MRSPWPGHANMAALKANVQNILGRCEVCTFCGVQTALDAVAPGGRIVLVGLGAEKCCVPTMQTVFKEIDFMGSFRYTNTVSTMPL